MLQVRSVRRLEHVELGLRHVAERQGATLLSTTRVGPEAFTFTVCLAEACDPLLAADARFAALLPLRIAAYAQGGTVTLEAISTREFCRMLHRPELEPLAIPLEQRLVEIMQQWAGREHGEQAEHAATEDQINMRAALPQRIVCHGTKVEELAGTGVHDAQGG